MRLALALLLAGCIHDSLERCGDQLCPETAVCRLDVCVPRDALDACGAAPDGSVCITRLNPDGVCIGGVCSERGCGNHVVDPGEVCDGDNCDEDCRAIIGCPPPGMTPVFGTSIELAVNRSCSSFTTDSTRHAAGSCAINGNSVIAYGPLGGSLETASGIENAGYEPVLTPEGDEIWVVQLVGSSHQLARFASDGNGQWGPASTFSLQSLNHVDIGVPSRGPEHHFMAAQADDATNIPTIREIVVSANGSATEVGRYGFTELFGAGGQFHMSADGLRITYLGTQGNGVGVMYADRASVTDRFANPRMMVASGATSFFTSGDCSRTYLPILGGEYYVRQIGWR
ncbi:MAG TPA: hypothetical protein VL326_04225 [Kofleriaceae bacterium]|nr:hypothetical protein [Kofleriaceae bacterium]